MAFNSRLDSVQAAVLQVKLQHLNRWNALRRQHAALYSTLLTKRADVTLPAAVEPNSQHVFHLYAIRVPQRAATLQHFEQHGIGAGIHSPFLIVTA